MIGIWFILGLRISRYVAILLTLLLTFNVGGMLSLTQMKDMTGGPMYIAVSTFLALTSVFYAAIIEDSAKRLPLIFNAWVFAAVITSSLGILGYFHAFPGARSLHALRPCQGRLSGSERLRPVPRRAVALSRSRHSDARSENLAAAGRRHC